MMPLVSAINKSVQSGRLSERDYDLCLAARRVAENAYAPYSGFAVGAAVRTAAGSVYLGSNLENATYGLGICAEVAALSAANTSGDYDVEAIAICGFLVRPDLIATQVVTPCGRCRQLIAEASELATRDISVFSCSGDLSEIESSTISQLLPNSFGPGSIGVKDLVKQMRRALQE